MRLVGESAPDGDLRQWCEGLRYLFKRTMASVLQTKMRRRDAKAANKATGDSLRRQPVLPGPPRYSRKLRQAQIVSETIGPVHDGLGPGDKLGHNAFRRGHRIPFTKTHDTIRIRKSRQPSGGNSYRQRQIEDLGPGRAKAIQMGIKTRVQNDITGAHMNPTKAAAFLIPAGQYHSGIGIGVTVPCEFYRSLPVLAAKACRTDAQHRQEPRGRKPIRAPLMALASVPDTNARIASDTSSWRRSGIIELIPAIKIPTEPKLAKPQRA